MNQLTIDFKTSFHNSIPLYGDELVNAEAAARNQEERILYLFRTYQKATPSEIMTMYDKLWPHAPLTSLRRGITNLTNRGKLRMSGTQRMGLYGKNENEWEIV